MTILVPGWSRADYLLEYLINSIFFTFILFVIFLDDDMKKRDLKGFSSDFFLNILDIVNTAIEKLMTILVLGWSRVDYLLEY